MQAQRKSREAEGSNLQARGSFASVSRQERRTNGKMRHGHRKFRPQTPPPDQQTRRAQVSCSRTCISHPQNQHWSCSSSGLLVTQRGHLTPLHTAWTTATNTIRGADRLPLVVTQSRHTWTRWALYPQGCDSHCRNPLPGCQWGGRWARCPEGPWVLPSYHLACQAGVRGGGAHLCSRFLPSRMWTHWCSVDQLDW